MGRHIRTAGPRTGVARNAHAGPAPTTSPTLAAPLYEPEPPPSRGGAHRKAARRPAATTAKETAARTDTDRQAALAPGPRDGRGIAARVVRAAPPLCHKHHVLTRVVTCGMPRCGHAGHTHTVAHKTRVSIQAHTLGILAPHTHVSTHHAPHPSSVMVKGLVNSGTKSAARRAATTQSPALRCNH